ncbi:VIT1/CCC1 transporter family protein [Prevotella sp. 10(H)]|uniref:VIT1/CCC1 transporter family protein n=1 Tax=Prevotella sp. 10(H) TaxID=1158294 RepID=UPI000691CD5E|nr:VIT1/CCC1 transporter family protein [Prevotella sp. 10(H)]
MRDQNTLSPEIKNKLLIAQCNEITESIVYRKIATIIKDEDNRKVINRIADQELYHAKTWKSYTQQDVEPNKFKVWFYVTVVRVLGLTFGIKLMERGERNAVIDYDKLSEFIPEAKAIQKDEEEHESQLIAMIKDKPLDYLGSIVLGLNDALVELTGVLAGLTFGLQNVKIIASVGIITGISAAFSMAGSEYLSTKTDGDGRVKPLTASVYTGIAYILTVVALILPYLLLSNVYMALAITISVAIIIIAVFNFYTAIAKDYSFKSRFWEMVAISLGVAFISFIIGIVVKEIFNIEV